MNHSIFLSKKYLDLRFEDLTAGPIQKAKECILDTLGCIYAGLSFESSRVVRQYALNNYAPGRSTVIGSHNKLMPAGACLANSTAGHGPELDDTSSEAVVHVGVIVIPVALALGEHLEMGGKDILTAIVAGYDMHIKVGKAANPQTHLARGLHPTATCGMFGAAITAARLMGLTVEQTANALGIAGSFVAGNLECYSDGSLTKRLQPGIASSSGVTAAALAREGYTGPKSIFEGPRGFFHAYCEDPRPEELLGGDGFEIERISFKPHACCRFNQTAIDATLAIRARQDIDHRDITSILIELTETGYYDVGYPPEEKFNPKNVVDAQFSVPYSVAIACIEGQAFLKEYSEDAVGRLDVRELMKKITVKHAPDLDRYFPEAWPARVTIRMKDGMQHVEEVRYARGDPENPLSWLELLDKFNRLVPPSLLGEMERHRFIERLLKLEEIEDVRSLMEPLTGSPVVS